MKKIILLFLIIFQVAICSAKVSPILFRQAKCEAINLHNKLVWKGELISLDSSKGENRLINNENHHNGKTLIPDSLWEQLSGSSLSNDGKWLVFYIQIGTEVFSYLRNNKNNQVEKLGKYYGQAAFSADNQYILYKSAHDIYILRQVTDTAKTEFKNLKYAVLFGPDLITLKQQSNSNLFVMEIINIKNSSRRILSRSVDKMILINESDGLFYITKDKVAGSNILLRLTARTRFVNEVLKTNGDLKNLQFLKSSNALSLIESGLQDDKNTVDIPYVYFCKSNQLIKIPTVAPPGLIINPSEVLSHGFTIKPNRILLMCRKIESEKKPVKTSDPEGLVVWDWSQKERDVKELAFNKVLAPEIFPQAVMLYYELKSHKLIPLGNLSSFIMPKVGDIAVRTSPVKLKDEFVLGYNADIELVNLKSGRVKSLFKNFEFGGRNVWRNSIASISPNGNLFCFFHNKQYHIYNFETQDQVTLTTKIDDTFWDEEYDSPKGVAPIYDIYWAKDSRNVYLHSRNHVYRCSIDGKSFIKLTDFSNEDIVFRMSKLNGGEFIVENENAIYFDVKGLSSGYQGLFLWTPSELRPLIFEDYLVRDFRVNIDRTGFTFIKERTDTPPSLYHASHDFHAVNEVFKTNATYPLEKPGKSELITYISHGRKLHGVLYYPFSYDPNRKYPVICHVYEKLSQNYNRFNKSNELLPYDKVNFNRRGYFVFEPDIVMQINNPGISAAECIIAGVNEVIKRPSIDKANIGLIGHSWGGYETGFTISQTNLFKAAIAGAPLSDLTSMYLGVRWDDPYNMSFALFERDQARFSGPHYDEPEAYMRNSTVYQVKKIETPLLIQVGNKDGMVDWYQGIELFNALRRAGKICYMLAYRDEGHILAKQENVSDYALKQMQFFDHYLKGMDVSEWMKLTE